MNDDRVVSIDGQTFIVDIKSKQNKSWQGTIFWMQTQQKIPFRSTLELIRLLDSAVGTSQLNEIDWERP